jgi:hypothetical protein
MSARSRMTQRTTIERLAAPPAPPGDEDEWGGDPLPSAGQWNVLAGDVACWSWSTVEKEVQAEKIAVVEDLRAIVPKGTDVTERDRLNGIRDRIGTVIKPGVLLIEAVVNRRTHLELVLRGISA